MSKKERNNSFVRFTTLSYLHFSFLCFASALFLLTSCGDLLLPPVVTGGGTPATPPAPPAPPPPCTGGTVNKVYMGGLFTPYLGVLSTDGTSAPCFTSNVDNTVRSIAVTPDGLYFYAAGTFVTAGGTVTNQLIRYNNEGVLDTAFSSGTGFNGKIYSIVTDSLYNVYAVGAFTTYQGFSSPHIVKILSDGTIDATFVVGTGFDLSPYTVSLDTLGQVLVGGAFTSYNGAPAPRLARLTTLGALDGTFVPGTGPNGAVYRFLEDGGTGLLYFVGSFTSYSGTSSRRIARTDALGAIDATFLVGTGFDNTVFDFAFTTAGPPQLMVGGAFANYNGAPALGLVRLNNDATLDGTFISGTGPNLPIYSVVMSADLAGGVYAAGEFTTYNGVPAPYAIRVDSAGTLDVTFNPSPNAAVYTIASR